MTSFQNHRHFAPTFYILLAIAEGLFDERICLLEKLLLLSPSGRYSVLRSIFARVYECKGTSIPRHLHCRTTAKNVRYKGLTDERQNATYSPAFRHF